MTINASWKKDIADGLTPRLNVGGRLLDSAAGERPNEKSGFLFFLSCCGEEDVV